MEAKTHPERRALADKQIRTWMTETAPDHLAFYKVWKQGCTNENPMPLNVAVCVEAVF